MPASLHIVFVVAFVGFVAVFVCANWKGRRSP